MNRQEFEAYIDTISVGEMHKLMPLNIAKYELKFVTNDLYHYLRYQSNNDMRPKPEYVLHEERGVLYFESMLKKMLLRLYDNNHLLQFMEKWK